MDDVESIERATLAAVPPRSQAEVGGWLLGFDDGTVGRSRSAVPLRHAPLPAGDTEAVVRMYRERGQPPMFRLPDLPAFEAVQARLATAGFSAGKPTLVQQVPVRALMLSALLVNAQIEVRPLPDDDWAGVFLGEGFDPIDGASRVAILRRARNAAYARAQQDGRVVAVGTACFSHGWCGIHGMRTAASHRGLGLARAILSALAGEAHARGIVRAFLQVEEGNEAARSLYRKAEFATAWRYRYWA